MKKQKKLNGYIVAGIVFLILGAFISVFAHVIGLIFVVISILLIIYGIRKKSSPKSAARKTPVPNNPEYNYYSFRVDGISYHEDAIILSLLEPNEDYKLSKSALIKEDMIEEAIYKYDDYLFHIRLIPEPDHPHDPDAIRVESDNVLFGYVPKEKTSEVFSLLDRIHSAYCHISGGPYKEIIEGYNDKGDRVYSVKTGESHLSCTVTLKYGKGNLGNA